jgi:ABC-type Fe3+ transport system substrate-binding protein
VFAKLWAAFSLVYPGIQPSLVSITSDAVAKLITLKAAGAPIPADLVELSPDENVALVSRGMVVAVPWTTYGVAPSSINVQNQVAIQAHPEGIVYNTTLVTAAQLPNTWDALLNSKWANGKMTQDPRGRPFDELALVWGEPKALSYTKQLKALAPVVIQGTQNGLAAVISGQVWMQLGGDVLDVKIQQAAGAPVAIKYMDLVPYDGDSLELLTGAPDPNAGTCFTAWLAGPAGQAEFLKDQFVNASMPDLPATSKVVAIQTAADAALVAKVAQEEAVIWAAK